MRYLAFAVVGVLVGVIFMLGYTLNEEINRSDYVVDTCQATDMAAVSGGRVMKVYKCLPLKEG